MSQKLESVVATVESLSLLEVADLVKMLEERLGVSASPQFMSVAAPVSGSQEEDTPQKTEFDLVLISGGSNKIAVIKEIRSITGLGLKEAKDASEGSNVVLKSGISQKDAEDLRVRLEAAGASVKIS